MNKTYDKLKTVIGQKFQLSFPVELQPEHPIEIRGELEIRWYDLLCNVIHMVFRATYPEPLTFFYRPVKHLLLDKAGNWMHVDEDQVVSLPETRIPEDATYDKSLPRLLGEIIEWAAGL